MTNPEEVLTVYTSAEAGVELTTHFTQIADGSGVLGNGSKFKNSGKVVLWVRKTAATARLMTVVSQHNCNFNVAHARTYSCTGTAREHMIGPFSTRHFNDSTGHTHITWDGTDVTDLIVAVEFGSTVG